MLIICRSFSVERCFSSIFVYFIFDSSVVFFFTVSWTHTIKITTKKNTLLFFRYWMQQYLDLVNARTQIKFETLSSFLFICYFFFWLSNTRIHGNGKGSLIQKKIYKTCVDFLCMCWMVFISFSISFSFSFHLVR